MEIQELIESKIEESNLVDLKDILINYNIPENILRKYWDKLTYKEELKEIIIIEQVLPRDLLLEIYDSNIETLKLTLNHQFLERGLEDIEDIFYKFLNKNIGGNKREEMGFRRYLLSTLCNDSSYVIDSITPESLLKFLNNEKLVLFLGTNIFSLFMGRSKIPGRWYIENFDLIVDKLNPCKTVSDSIVRSSLLSKLVTKDWNGPKEYTLDDLEWFEDEIMKEPGSLYKPGREDPDLWEKWDNLDIRLKLVEKYFYKLGMKIYSWKPWMIDSDNIPWIPVYLTLNRKMRPEYGPLCMKIDLEKDLPSLNLSLICKIPSLKYEYKKITTLSNINRSLLLGRANIEDIAWESVRHSSKGYSPLPEFNKIKPLSIIKNFKNKTSKDKWILPCF